MDTMRKKSVVFFAFLPLLTALLTFVFTGGIASAQSAGTVGHIQPSVTIPAIALATGGCAEHTGGPNSSFEMGICISNRGTAHTVYPDVYVNKQPTGPFSCTLYIEIWAGGTKLSQDAGHSCTVGHYNSTSLTALGGCAALHTSAWISYSGTFYRIGDSPTYTYC